MSDPKLLLKNLKKSVDATFNCDISQEAIDEIASEYIAEKIEAHVRANLKTMADRDVFLALAMPTEPAPLPKTVKTPKVVKEAKKAKSTKH